MSVVEEMRLVLQDFFAPEMREIHARLDPVDRRLDASDKRIDTIENANGMRQQSIIPQLEQIQQSFAFDKRISVLEAEKMRSA